MPGINDLGAYVGSQRAGVNIGIVPEPGTVALALVGLIGLAAARRRKGA